MKTLFIIALFAGLFAGAAESKTRYFDADGKPLPEGKTGPLSIVCQTDGEWNDSGCPPNLVKEGNAIRLKTAAEKKAEIDAAKLENDAKAKDEHEKSLLGKLEKEVEALRAEVEALKKK